MVTVVKFLSSIAPKLAVFESMKTAPLRYDKNGPARTAAEVIGSTQAAPPEGSKALIDKASSKDETLHEPGNEQVVSRVPAWLDTRAPVE